ncbi:unnamed protein product [Fraxinus pennsylvanica]|uniref:Transmembrane protein n=1 Tax=Fraxinus pennsylvanica TaxID=56036 RepID=A0AAD1ZEQ4_9LAMI|nr:unnamed protein product [Fraxinus pennsylvanica]
MFGNWRVKGEVVVVVAMAVIAMGGLGWGGGIRASDFDGQEVSLKLHHDGHLGNFEGSSGKSYEVVSYKFPVVNVSTERNREECNKELGTSLSNKLNRFQFPK